MPPRQVPSLLAQYTTHIVRGLIDQESSLEIIESRTREDTLLEVRVAPDDVGKLIGRGGVMADSIRHLLYAFSRKHRLGRLELQFTENRHLAGW